MEKNTNSPMKKEQQRARRAKAQRPVQREAKEVLAELVEKLKGKLELKATSASTFLSQQPDFGVRSHSEIGSAPA